MDVSFFSLILTNLMVNLSFDRYSEGWSLVVQTEQDSKASTGLDDGNLYDVGGLLTWMDGWLASYSVSSLGGSLRFPLLKVVWRTISSFDSRSALSSPSFSFSFLSLIFSV